jgi:bacillithiol biosynthesis cysteine-adding enzyme BshC
MTVEVFADALPLSPLVRRAVQPGDADGWYVPRPRGLEWAQRAKAARASVPANWLDALAPAFDAQGPARQRLERAAGSGVVVTTGQQPGLFGGPLYTWFKALTALALADELERLTGLPVAPVFWAATDDSDVAEATSTVVSLPGGAETIRHDVAAEHDTPLALVPLGDASIAIARLAAACGSASNAAVLDVVRSAYTARATLGGAYVKLLRHILHPLGIAVLDAAHPATRAAASPVLKAALTRAGAISERLEARTQEIIAQGLKPQVRAVPGRTLVFMTDGERRKRVRIADATHTAQQADVGELTPNVLLRPIAERVIMPTVAYVGGPAELAYFAQVSAVAEALEVETPLAVPRWSGFLIEPHIARALEELGATVEELRDPHLLEGRVARAEIPPPVRALLDETRQRIADLAPTLTETAQRSALPAQTSVIEGSVRQLLHKLDRLERRVVAAVKRRGSERLHALATARGALFPGGVPQERALNMVPFLAKYGDEVLQRVLSATRAHVSSL